MFFLVEGGIQLCKFGTLGRQVVLLEKFVGRLYRVIVWISKVMFYFLAIIRTTKSYSSMISEMEI